MLIAHRITAHPLLEYVACRLLQYGVDLYTVCKLMGHSSIRVAEHYAALVNVQIHRSAIAALARTPIQLVAASDGTRDTGASHYREESPDLVPRAAPK